MFYLTRIGQLVQTSQLSFSVWRPWLAAQSFTRLLTTNFKIRIIFEHHTHAARCKLINVVQAVSVSPRISIIFCHHSVLFTIAELLLLDSMSEWINRIWSFTDKCILHLYLILESWSIIKQIKEDNRRDEYRTNTLSIDTRYYQPSKPLVKTDFSSSSNYQTLIWDAEIIYLFTFNKCW